MKTNKIISKVKLLLISVCVAIMFIGCGGKTKDEGLSINDESFSSNDSLSYDGTFELGNKVEFKINRITLPEKVGAGKTTKIDDNIWYYDLDSEGNAINAYVYGNYSGDITLPSMLDGHQVISIGKDYYGGSENPLFCRSAKQGRYYDDITSITVPEGVEYINHGAFAGCENLQKVILPDSLIYIGNDAFNGSRNLAYVNSDIEGKIVMPKNLKYYGESLFRYNDKINSFEFPKQINYIQDWTFYQTKGFEDLTIQGQFKYIGIGAFADSTIKKLTIEDGVEIIGGSAFSMNSLLNEVDITDSVVAIGGQAFQLCPLKQFKYNGKLKYVGKKVFEYNTKQDWLKKERLPQ